MGWIVVSEIIQQISVQSIEIEFRLTGTELGNNNYVKPKPTLRLGFGVLTIYFLRTWAVLCTAIIMSNPSIVLGLVELWFLTIS